MKSLKEVTGQIVSVVWHYCQRFSLHCWGKVFQWLPKDWHKKVISTKWDTCLEWITNWHYPELRGYFTLKLLLHSGLKQVMSPFTLGSARAVLVVALVYSFPDVFNVIIKHPNAYIAIKWNLNLLVITFSTTLTPLARVVSRNEASPSDGDNKRLVCVNIQSFIKLSKRSKILIFTSWLSSGLSRWVVGCTPGFC
jgi:hypothetical protein